MGEEYKEHVMHNQIASQGSAPRRAPLAILLVAQLVAGFALGAGLAYLGSILGGLAVAVDPAGFRDIVAMIGGVLIGYPLGVAGGAWLVGRLFGAHGRLWATLLGAYLGVGAMLLAARLFVTGDFLIGWLLMIALSLAGACAGYHMSARGKAS
jgi:hypothetical protein